MRRRDGSFPPKRTYTEIMEDLDNQSEHFKKTMLYKRLVMRAEMIGNPKGMEIKNNIK